MIKIDESGIVIGENRDDIIEVGYEEVMTMVRTVLMYYLADEIEKEERLVQVPDAESDGEMLRLLWRRAVSRLRDGVRGLTKTEALESSRQMELRELTVFALALSVARDWLFITARKEVARFSESLESAIASIRGLLLMPSSSVRVRRPASPF